MDKVQITERIRERGVLLAIFGLAALTLAREAFRYPVLAHVDMAGLVSLSIGDATIALSSVISVVGLAVLVVLAWRSGGRTRAFHPALLFLAACVITVGYFGRFNIAGSAEGYGFMQVMAELIQFFGLYLLAAWAAALYRNEGLFTLVIVGASYVVSGAIQGLLLLLQPAAGIVLASMAPVISVMLLYVYISEAERPTLAVLPLDSSRSRFLGSVLTGRAFAKGPAVAGDGSNAREEQGLFPEYTTNKARIWRYMACILVYGLVGAYQYASWQSGQVVSAGAVMIQLFGGLGTLLAGVLILVLLSRSKNAYDEFFWRAVILVVLVIALFISTFARNYSFASAFTLFVDLSYKLIMFFIWMLPLVLPRRANPLCAFLLFFFVHQLGGVVGLLTVGFDALQFGLILAGLIFLVAEFTESLVTGSRQAAPAAEKPKEAKSEGPSPEQQLADERAKTEAYKQALFGLYLMDRFRLTQREAEIMPMLEQGFSTKEIAQELIVSFDTAKTHRRNVLQKMGVANTTELNEKMAQLRETDFPEFLKSLV